VPLYEDVWGSEGKVQRIPSLGIILGQPGSSFFGALPQGRSSKYLFKRRVDVVVLMGKVINLWGTELGA
jgi:hypothetical protein